MTEKTAARLEGRQLQALLTAVEAQMVDYAGEFNPTALRRLVNHAIDVVAPEVAEEHNGKLLDRAEREHPLAVEDERHALGRVQRRARVRAPSA